MSTCISAEGEFDQHRLGERGTPTEFTCPRCGVFDEETCLRWLRRADEAARQFNELARSLEAEVRGLKSELADVTQQRDAALADVQRLSARVFEVTITYVSSADPTAAHWSMGKTATLFASSAPEAAARLSGVIGDPQRFEEWAFRVESIREVRL